MDYSVLDNLPQFVLMHGLVDPPGMVCALWEAQAGLCFHCHKPMTFLRKSGGAKGDHATREHVYPKSQTGRYLLNNIVLAHARCNNQRGCKEPSHEEITRAKAIYMIMGMTPFVEFSVWTKDQKFFVFESEHRAKVFTQARYRQLDNDGGYPGKLAELWPK
jgi:hypothetical protein